jgi:uncharacterized protein (DUF1015 family)
MPFIAPFRAIRYNPARFSDLSPLLTPPYDVISDAEQASHYTRHPHNMIRLDLGHILPTDSDRDNRYSRAARLFAQWRREAIFIQDEHPALYPTSIRYTPPSGETKTLLGLFALVRLEPFDTGQILPHEMTFAAAKQDRLLLLRECRAHFSPIFLITPDPDGRLRPLLEAAVTRAEEAGHAAAGESDQFVQRIWRLADPALIDDLRAVIGKAPLLIADGHHRYETALNYRKEMAGAGVDSPADYCLAFIAASHDPGLSILPTHRVLARLPDFDPRQLLAQLGDRFSITTPVDPQAPAAVSELLAAVQQGGRTQPTFGLIGPDGRMHVLTSRQPAAAQLDVRILQSEILDELLHVHEEEAMVKGQLRYVKDPQEAARLVRTGDAQLAFLLNPTPIEAIETIARGGGRMPRKTTYFLPKPFTGFVIYPVG